MAPRLRSARNATLRALDRMSLLAPAYRAYERMRSRRGPEEGEVDACGLPVPPPRLRVEVAGTPGLDWFLDSGRQQAEIIRTAAARNGMPLGSTGALLDFGCGCGRVLRLPSNFDGHTTEGRGAVAELAAIVGAPAVGHTSGGHATPGVPPGTQRREGKSARHRNRRWGGVAIRATAPTVRGAGRREATGAGVPAARLMRGIEVNL